jgi:hypothetical protein
MTLENASKESLPGVSGITTPDPVITENSPHAIEQGKEENGAEKIEAQAVEAEYPTGKRLFPILAAVILAVFLVALDLVSSLIVLTSTRH